MASSLGEPHDNTRAPLGSTRFTVSRSCICRLDGGFQKEAKMQYQDMELTPALIHARGGGVRQLSTALPLSLRQSFVPPQAVFSPPPLPPYLPLVRGTGPAFHCPTTWAPTQPQEGDAPADGTQGGSTGHHKLRYAGGASDGRVGADRHHVATDANAAANSTGTGRY